MRFTVSIVGPNGKLSSKHPILPPGVVRMDDSERFRLLFENDWKSPGQVSYVYDGSPNTLSLPEPIEHGELVPSPQTFTYTRTESVGIGRLIEVSFKRAGVDTVSTMIMLINNDYNKDGSAIHFGDENGDVIRGRATRAEDDPDRERRM
jgi:hypothetical protein